MQNDKCKMNRGYASRAMAVHNPLKAISPSDVPEGHDEVRRFEELPVWQKAIELGVNVFEVLRAHGLRTPSGLRDQLERAVVSISNNIAEGFERGTHEELLTFLYYARGSAGEVRSMLHMLARLAEDDESHASIEGNRLLAENISRQLGAWVESLKNGAAKDPRRITDESRRREDEFRRRNDYVEKLNQIAQTRPLTPAPDTSPPSAT
jgi:four helix bundle protein